MTHTPLTTQQHDGIDELYRDDVREPLEAAGWHETAEDCVVAPNGALWTEMTPALDSGIDAPDKAWSVAFDSNVPAPIIVAAALAAAGTDVPALLADNHRLRADLADFSGRVNELESHLCDCQPVREHDDYKRPAFYQHEPHCPVNELTQPAVEVAHVVADDSSDPEHTDDCPGCEPAARPVAASEDTR